MNREDLEDIKKFLLENLKNINFTHYEMSQATEVEVTNLKESMREFKGDFSKFRDDIRKEIKEGFSSLDKRFASKMVERIVFTGVGVVGLWVLNKFLDLI